MKRVVAQRLLKRRGRAAQVRQAKVPLNTELMPRVS